MRRLIRIVIRFAMLAAVIAGIYYGGAFALPDNARAQRHISITAAPGDLIGLVSELRNYPKWLAWNEAAPGISYGFSGPQSGAGQKMTWSSASALLQQGTGEAVMASAEAIEIKLEGGVFHDALMRLQLEPVEGGTGVTWTITMANDRVAERWRRYFTFERDVAPFMVKSLANLKDMLEQKP